MTDMETFGNIKTKIENLLSESYTQQNFNRNLREFRSRILENKNLATAYYFYNILSNESGISVDIADDYIIESIEKVKEIVKKEADSLNDITTWLDERYKKNVDNNYNDVDVMVYETSFRKLDKILESKNRIKSLIIKEINLKINKGIDIPLSSMLKIATKTYNDSFSDINNEDREELSELLKMKKNEIKENFTMLKDELLSDLNISLNESSDDEELKMKITQTINKINDADPTLVSLYKLRQLKQGL